MPSTMTENTEEKNSLAIAFRGSAEYRRSLQEEALKRGIKVQQLLEDAVSAYISSPAKTGGQAQDMPPHLAELMPALDAFFDPTLDLGAAHNRLRDDMRQVLKERLWESHPKFKKGKR